MKPAEPKLVIRSVNSPDDKIHVFDVYVVAKKTKLSILDPQKSGGAAIFGQLAPFYQKFRADLMDYLVKA